MKNTLQSLYITLTTLVLTMSALVFAPATQAGGGLTAEISQLGIQEGGQALKATVFQWEATSSESGQLVPWAHENFVFKSTNSNDGVVCQTQQTTSNGAGEIFGSCINTINNNPFEVIVERVAEYQISQPFTVNPTPISAPISNPDPTQPPISAPITPPGTTVFTPEFVTASIANGTFSKPYKSSIKVVSNDVENPISVTFENLPSGVDTTCEEGLEFLRARRAATCYLKGLPTTSGQFTIVATAAVGDVTLSKNYPLTLTNRPISLTTSGLTTGKVDKAYQAKVVVSDPDLSDTLSVEITGLPEGLSYHCTQGFNLLRTQLQKSCEITGSPSATGTYSVSIQAKDSANNSASKQQNVSILPAKQSNSSAPSSAKPPVISTTTLKQARTGLYYQAVVKATAFAKESAPTIELSNLPEGLSSVCASSLDFFGKKYNAHCRISGQVTTAGTYVMEATITDSQNQTDQVQLALEVINRPVRIFTAALPQGQVGKSYKAEIKTVDQDIHDVLSVDVSNLPAGISVSCQQKIQFFNIDTFSTCRLEGTPTTAGTVNVLVVADDGAGHSATRTIPLKIK